MTVMAAEAAPEISRGEFRGNASEYFGIWIVNILLTIITLGVYSAWAKVRRNRYFYGNSYVAGHSFDYHARGLQIFIGRLIVLVLVIVLNIISALEPLLAVLTSLLFLAVLPWFLARGLRFSARVTSYRNVRFDFVGTAWGAFKAVVLGGLVAGVTLGIMAPYASRWFYRYVFNNLRYGDRPFSTDPKLGKLYGAWFAAFLITLFGIAILATIGVLLWPAVEAVLAGVDQDDPGVRIGLVLGFYAVLLPVVLLWIIAGIFYRIGIRNVVMNATVLDERHGLVSDMGRLRYFWILISNLIVTIFTFGLMRPWAAVREHRYMVEHTGIRIDGDIGAVMASIQETGSAFSAEYLDIEGFDFGF